MFYFKIMQAKELLDLLEQSGDILPERKKELEVLLNKSHEEQIDDEPEDIDDGGPGTSLSISQINVAQKEQKYKMYYGLLDDYSFLLDKKRMKMKDSKEGRRKEAPPIERIPLPSLPENVKQEYRASYRDTQQKKYRITPDNPPSVCMYTVLNANNSLCSASIADDGSMYALGYSNSIIQVDALSSEYLKILKKPDELEHIDLECLTEEVYDPQDQPKSVNFTGHSGPVYSVSFSCEKRLLLSGSRDSTVRLWNLEMARNLVIYRPMAPVWQAKFCSRGYYFAVSTADQTVSLWATDRLKPLRVFADAKDDVTVLDFHPNCNYIAGGSEDHIIRVWDVLTGTCVRTFAGHNGPIRGLRTSNCGRYLISVSEDESLAVWDLAQQKLMAIQECHKFEHNTPIVPSRDGSAIAVATPKYGASFFSLDAVISNSSGQPMLNPPYSYKTKNTSILDFHFTRKNVVVAIGVFEQ